MAYAQKARRIKHTDPGAPNINWLVAREVPAEVYLWERENRPVGGTIVFGPLGQQTYLGNVRGRNADVGPRDSYRPS